MCTKLLPRGENVQKYFHQEKFPFKKDSLILFNLLFVSWKGSYLRLISSLWFKVTKAKAKAAANFFKEESLTTLHQTHFCQLHLKTWSYTSKDCSKLVQRGVSDDFKSKAFLSTLKLKAADGSFSLQLTNYFSYKWRSCITSKLCDLYSYHYKNTENTDIWPKMFNSSTALLACVHWQLRLGISWHLVMLVFVQSNINDEDQVHCTYMIKN